MLLALAAVLLSATRAPAHPISLTQAKIRVGDREVRVELEIFVEDLYFFHDLEPNAEDRLSADDIRRGVELHKAFLLERFRILNAAGETLEGKVRDVVMFELQPDGVAMSDLMEHKLSYQLHYDLGERPEFLTFSQHFSDELLVGLPAEMKILVYQGEVDTPYQATLEPDRPKTIRFDWENPPLAPDAPDEAWEAWFDQQQEQLLGITSYSSVYSFLYIEDREIRHEILIPLVSLEASVELPRQDPSFLTVAEQRAAAEAIGRFFAAHNPVEVDGQPVEGQVRQVQFYGVDFKDFASRPEPRKVSLASGRAGIIIAYPIEQPAARVQMQWDAFNAHVWDVKTTVYLGEQVQQVTLSHLSGQDTYYLDRPRPERHAASPTALPVLSEHRRPPRYQRRIQTAAPVLLGSIIVLLPAAVLLFRRGHRWSRIAGTVGVLLLAAALALLAVGWAPATPRVEIDDETARDIFQQLHANLYESFAASSESQVYDALATSLSGPMLRDTYLQIRDGLVLHEQGGAIATIQDVQLQETRIPQDSPLGAEFECTADWTVTGTVEHWGHIHQRTHRYNARFQLSVVDEQWKITGMEVLDEQQVEQRTRIRRLASPAS